MFMDMKPPRKPSRLSRRALPWTAVVSLCAAILAWELVSRFSGLPAFILPAPERVAVRFWQALADGNLLLHTAVTLSEVLLGLLSGTVAAVALGYAIAKSRLFERLVAPYLVASQAIPIVAIAPLLVIWFGPGMFSKVLICALIVFFPVLVNTVVGVRAVPQPLHDLMRSLRATRGQIIRRLEVPAALPVLLGGLRIGATLSVIGAVVGELVGADQGLGFLVNTARGLYDTAMVFVAVLTLILLALALYGVVALMEKKLLSWQEVHE
ncbi:MAG: NitT/TauT family transport system permease protein [Anaerolineaceae bacterium]|nr:MAG: NitT/TauT family transport system permease protein [Anaerolineaceae bacterium]